MGPIKDGALAEGSANVKRSVCKGAEDRIYKRDKAICNWVRGSLPLAMMQSLRLRYVCRTLRFARKHSFRLASFFKAERHSRPNALGLVAQLVIIRQPYRNRCSGLLPDHLKQRECLYLRAHIRNADAQCTRIASVSVQRAIRRLTDPGNRRMVPSTEGD